MFRLCRVSAYLLILVAVVAVTSSATAQLQFHNLTPCRAVDTRSGYGGILPSATLRTFQLRNICGIPNSPVTVTYTVTAISPTLGGFLVLWPSDKTIPGVSNLTFNAGEPAISNGGIVPLSVIPSPPTNDISIAYGVASGSGNVHVLIDVTGYFQ
jgi:hypothetical protein